MSLIRMFWIRLLQKASVACLIVAILTSFATCAQASPSNVSDDLAVFPVDNWSFAYADGAETLLHIEIGGRDFLWNPDDLHLFYWQPQLERLPKANVSLEPRGLGEPAIPPSDNGNASAVNVLAAKVWTDHEMFIHYYDPRIARLSWDEYFEFRGLDGGIEDFFVVVAEKKGAWITSRFEYQGDESTFRTVETLTQDLGPGQVGAIMKLSRGRILLAVPQSEAFPCKKSCSYMVEFRKLPSSALSIDGRVFLIPYDIMETALHKAGPTLRARYDAVRHIISSALPIPLTTLGRSVPPADPVRH